MNASENKARAKIESYYLRLKRNVIYTSLEDIEDTEWFWSPSEVKEFDKLWNINMTLEGIAERLGRSNVSVLLLALDRIHRGKVELRNWDIW